jgi:hypothetical protein
VNALRSFVLPAVAAGLVVAAGSAQADPIPLRCEEDELGVSVEMLFSDTSPEFEEQSELRDCNQAPIGVWNSVAFADETDDSVVSVLGEARSDDGFVLEVVNELDLVADDGTFDESLVTIAVQAQAIFDAPEGADPIDAEVVVEIERTGELEGVDLSLAVVGEDVDFTEDLEDEPDGEQRFDVELEPGEEYRALVTANSRLDDTGAGAQTVRFRVETVSVPEAGAPLLAAAGAAVLAAAGRTRRQRGGRSA